MPTLPPLLPRELLTRMFAAAVDAARPERCIPPFVPAPPVGRTKRLPNIPRLSPPSKTAMAK